MGFEELLGWWTRGGAECVESSEHGSAVPLAPWLAQCITGLFLNYTFFFFFLISWWSSKWNISQNSVSGSSKLIKPLRSFLGSSETQWQPGFIMWLLKGRGAVSKGWALNLQDVMLSVGRYCQNWGELYDPQLVLENCLTLVFSSHRSWCQNCRL